MAWEKNKGTLKKISQFLIYRNCVFLFFSFFKECMYERECYSSHSNVKTVFFQRRCVVEEDEAMRFILFYGKWKKEKTKEKGLEYVTAE